MKLTNNDKDFLKELGYQEEDIKQIEEATMKTTYEMDSKRISYKKVIEELGRKNI